MQRLRFPPVGRCRAFRCRSLDAAFRTGPGLGALSQPGEELHHDAVEALLQRVGGQRLPGAIECLEVVAGFDLRFDQAVEQVEVEAAPSVPVQVEPVLVGRRLSR